jgi:hypothetical protein
VAATVEASRLTEAHRLAQARLGALTARQVLAAWPLLDVDDLDGSFGRWLLVVTRLVQAQRRASSTLAAGYLTTFRTLELGVTSEPVTPTFADPADEHALAASMVVTGPAAIRSASARGVPLPKAVDLARAGSSRSAMRHALNGGRDTIAGTVKTDSKALGYARATSGRACHFCAMLAGRGPVYKGAGSADFPAHDGCSCTVEPVYRKDAAWPAGARRYQQVWRQATAGMSGPEATNAFRQALTAQA